MDDLRFGVIGWGYWEAKFARNLDSLPHDISILLYLSGKKPEQVKLQAHAHLQPYILDIAHIDLTFAEGVK